MKGLTVGGDDYVTKPFSLEELVARVRAVLRRTRKTDDERRAARRSPTSSSTTTRHEVWRGRRPHRAHADRVQAAALPDAQRAPRALSKAQILDHVWEYDFDGDANVVETYISYLRKKLDPLGPPLIHTMRGVGYTPAPPARGLTVSLRARLTLGLVVLAAIGLGRRRPRDVSARCARSCSTASTSSCTTALRRPRSRARAAVLPAGGYLRGAQTGRRRSFGGEDAFARRRRPARPARTTCRSGRSRSTPPASGTAVPRRRRADRATGTRSSSRSRSTTCSRRCAGSCSSSSSSPAIVLGGLAAARLVARRARAPSARADGRHRRRDRGGRPLPPRRARDRRRPRSAGSASRSTACSGRSRVRSPNATRPRRGCASSSPTRRTSCARRSRRSAATPSCSAAARTSAPKTSPRRCGASRTKPTRMGVLVDDLLLLARLDQGRPLEHESVDLSRLARDAVDDARAAHPTHAIDVSDERRRSSIVGDEARLRQVLANLLANACTHTPDGNHGAGRRARCTAATPSSRSRRRSRPHCRRSRARLRAVLARRRCAPRSSGGAGLGLSIVRGHRRRPRRHRRGRAPTPGEGATFRVRLPRACES